MRSSVVLAALSSGAGRAEGGGVLLAHLSDPHLRSGPLGAAPARGLHLALARVLALDPRPDRVVITGDLADRDVFDPARGHVRLIEGLKPLDDEPVLHKTSHNAFTTTNLGQYLTAHGVTEVVVTGIRTEQCCETTARLASDLGYQVTFVLDATATMPLERWDGAGMLTVDEVLQRTAS